MGKYFGSLMCVYRGWDCSGENLVGFFCKNVNVFVFGGDCGVILFCSFFSIGGEMEVLVGEECL